MAADAPEWIRPATAAARFDVSERTLARWAQAGLIGRSAVGRHVWYRAGDVADVIAAGARARAVEPATVSVQIGTAAPADRSWRDDPFWAGTAVTHQGGRVVQ